MSNETQQPQSELRPVAVFDYDGTCIDEQSGKLIATWLLKKGYLSPRGAAGLLSWGVRYKLHLPHRQERSRELIFDDLSGYTPEEIHKIMVEFHREVLVPRYRRRALAEIRRRNEEGCATVIISATFEPIACEAATYADTLGFVATRMETDETGSYTGRVLGDVIEGKAKVAAAAAWADAVLGEGAWRLAYAYGDHHSDTELLSLAEHPTAVCPGPTLRRTAKANGWPIVDWGVQ